MTVADDEIKRKVFFYAVYTLIYFPVLIVVISLSSGIYIIREGRFQSILFLIAVAETVKHFAYNVFYQRNESSLSKKKDSFGGILSWFRIKEGIKTLMVTAIMTAMYFLISILFGAEVFDKHRESIMFSGLLSVLTVFPVCLNLGCQSFLPLLLGVKATNKEETLFAQNLSLTLAGAWFGAMTIPLDWDRPWQVWPIPCSLASMLGYTVSHLIMLYRMKDSPRKKHKV